MSDTTPREQRAAIIAGLDRVIVELGAAPALGERVATLEVAVAELQRHAGLDEPDIGEPSIDDEPDIGPAVQS